MYRQITADALAEGEKLHEAVTQAQQRIQALEAQIARQATVGPQTPAPRTRTTRFSILPSTPRNKDSYIPNSPLSSESDAPLPC